MRTTTAMRAISTATAISAVCAGQAGAAGRVDDGSGMVIWGFLGFCALILVGQLLPALVSFLSAKKVVEQAIEESLGVDGEKQKVGAALDRE